MFTCRMASIVTNEAGSLGNQQPVDPESASESKHGFESIIYGVEKLDGGTCPGAL
jgi:hypothetical protein